MTRQQVLAHIQAELAKTAAEAGIPLEDGPRAFGYVISETLTWLGESDDEEEMAGLATYFAYRLFHAKQITQGKTPSADFLTDMQAAEGWATEAGFDFAGGDA